MPEHVHRELEWSPGSVGGTLKVEAYGTERSTQEFGAKFAMTVSVPPNTKKILFSSVWRLRGGATAAGEATAGCSMRHSQVNYIVETAIFYADGTYGLVPVVGFGVPVSREFSFTETLESSKSFPRTMTLWAELVCVAYGQVVRTPSSAEVTLWPESGDGLGTALLHLHAGFPK